MSTNKRKQTTNAPQPTASSSSETPLVGTSDGDVPMTVTGKQSKYLNAARIRSSVASPFLTQPFGSAGQRAMSPTAHSLAVGIGNRLVEEEPVEPEAALTVNIPSAVLRANSLRELVEVVPPPFREEAAKLLVVIQRKAAAYHSVGATLKAWKAAQDAKTFPPFLESIKTPHVQFGAEFARGDWDTLVEKLVVDARKKALELAITAKQAEFDELEEAISPACFGFTLSELFTPLSLATSSLVAPNFQSGEMIGTATVSTSDRSLHEALTTAGLCCARVVQMEAAKARRKTELDRAKRELQLAADVEMSEPDALDAAEIRKIAAEEAKKVSKEAAKTSKSDGLPEPLWKKRKVSHTGNRAKDARPPATPKQADPKGKGKAKAPPTTGRKHKEPHGKRVAKKN